MTPIPRIERGDELIAVNGIPFVWALRRGIDWMRPGEFPTSYLIEKADGRRITVELSPEPVSERLRCRRTALVQVLVLIVAAIYVAIGGVVWWLKPDRSEAWALAPVLFGHGGSTRPRRPRPIAIAWAWPRVLVNLPTHRSDHVPPLHDLSHRAGLDRSQSPDPDYCPTEPPSLWACSAFWRSHWSFHPGLMMSAVLLLHDGALCLIAMRYWARNAAATARASCETTPT